MTDNQDSSDEIQSISKRLSTVTTTDNNIPSPQQHQCNSRLPSTPKTVVTSSATIRSVQTSQPLLDMKKKSEDSTRVLDSVENDAVRNLPELNVPEKILLIIDVTRESNCTKFKLGTGATYMPMFMIKRVVEIFVGAKSSIKRSHEFAVMALCQDSIKWICDFTSNVKAVLNYLDSLAEEPIDDEESFFDLSQVFETIHAHVDLETGVEPLEAPTSVTRAILIYTRSNCIPRFQTGRQYFDVLMENPYFVLDSLFIHEPPSSDNKCEEVYTELTALDVKNFSYILEVGRNATKLHDNMAKLLAHPLQRPLQRNASYTITPPGAGGGGGAEDIQTNV